MKNEASHNHKSIVTKFCAGNKLKHLQVQSDLSQLVQYWESLENDDYLSGGYRQRRYSSGKIFLGEFSRLPSKPHYQKSKYNHLFGGVHRNFSEIAPQFFEEPQFDVLLKEVLRCLPVQRDYWNVDLHQFRIKAPGHPTPEGRHQDGVNFVFMMLVNRCNVTGGRTDVYKSGATKPTYSVNLSNIGEALLIDDRFFQHNVTPVALKNPSNGEGVRDLMVITFISEE